MSEIEQVKALVKERLKAAVEDIFGIIENVIKVYEKDSRSKWEIERQNDLLELDILLKPKMKLPRDEPPQLSVCKEEAPVQQQESSPRADQEESSPPPDQEDEEDPEPLQIKEEQEDAWPGPEGEQLHWLSDNDTKDSAYTVTCARRLHDQHQSPRLPPAAAHREGEPLPGTSAERMETEPDGGGYGASEPPGDWQPLPPDQHHQDADRDEDRTESGGPPLGFSTAESFHLHAMRMGVHAGSKSYTCTLCKKNFRFKSGLTVHMKIHAPYRPYSCNVCGKEMIRFSDFQRHMKTHTGERPYSCSICGKGFIRRDRVQDHMKTHTGERPYGCSVCGKGFIQSSDLKRHMKTHSGERH